MPTDPVGKAHFEVRGKGGKNEEEIGLRRTKVAPNGGHKGGFVEQLASQSAALSSTLPVPE